MKIITTLKTVLIAAILLSAAAFAIELDSAKTSGLVGEQENGYLGAIVISAEVTTLINDINAKRKAKYLELANKNGITLNQVEILAAKKAYEKTEAGLYLRSNGQWVKK
nr:YdbL family protein [uncultured Glaciecola sp.]